MNVDQLIRMANQIGTFFEAMPNRPEAIEGIAKHIKSFWEPRMRQAFLVHLDTNGNEGLNPVVIEAITQHRALLT
jgi:formate dehydrogenase subunit delta